MATRLAVLGVTITVLLSHSPAAQGPARRGDRAHVLVQRGLGQGKADQKPSTRKLQQKLQQQQRDRKLAEMRAKYRKAALAGHGKPAPGASGPGVSPGKPAPKRATPRRRLTIPELAQRFKAERPIIARYLLGAADINNDGLLSGSERDWVTLEMAKRQKRRLAAGPQAQQGAKALDERARALRRRAEARKEARTGKRQSKIKVLPKARITKRRDAWDRWTRSAKDKSPKRK